MRSPGAESERGFSLAALLLLVAGLGLAGLAWRVPAQHQWQREREAELLFRGLAYQRAIRSYYLAAQPHRFPKDLEDLILDPRFQHRRHLRMLYPEPFLGGAWVLLPALDGGIQGVASPFQGQPLQTKNLAPEIQKLDTSDYKNMQFIASR